LIDKQEFYHGVVLVRLLDDPSINSIRKREYGYIVNDNISVILKYSTKSRSPWLFSFSAYEMERIEHCRASFSKVIIALVCGGDGICAIELSELRSIGLDRSGTISVRRNYRRHYGVGGPSCSLTHRISCNRLNRLVFPSTT
jgi:hypothetical protein